MGLRGWNCLSVGGRAGEMATTGGRRDGLVACWASGGRSASSSRGHARLLGGWWAWRRVRGGLQLLFEYLQCAVCLQLAVCVCVFFCVFSAVSCSWSHLNQCVLLPRSPCLYIRLGRLLGPALPELAPLRFWPLLALIAYTLCKPAAVHGPPLHLFLCQKPHALQATPRHDFSPLRTTHWTALRHSSQALLHP